MIPTEIMEVISDKFERYCNAEDYYKIEEYLIAFPFLANYDDGIYFEIIVDRGNLQLIKLFVSHGAIIETENNYALYTCAHNKFYDCLEYVLQFTDVERIRNNCGYENAIKFINK